MNFPAYSKISQATTDLTNALKITPRRECANALKQLLFDTNLRSKLAQEAVIAARDKKKTPHDVLAKIYSNAIKATIHAAQKTFDSSTKAKTEDIRLPVKEGEGGRI